MWNDCCLDIWCIFSINKKSCLLNSLCEVLASWHKSELRKLIESRILLLEQQKVPGGEILIPAGLCPITERKELFNYFLYLTPTISDHWSEMLHKICLIVIKCFILSTPDVNVLCNITNPTNNRLFVKVSFSFSTKINKDYILLLLLWDRQMLTKNHSWLKRNKQ